MFMDVLRTHFQDGEGLAVEDATPCEPDGSHEFWEDEAGSEELLRGFCIEVDIRRAYASVALNKSL
jgi:hypothetical protein